MNEPAKIHAMIDDEFFATHQLRLVPGSSPEAKEAVWTAPGAVDNG